MSENAARGAVTRIAVGGPTPYDVMVGHGIMDRHLPPLLDGVVRCAVIVPESLQELGKASVVAAEFAGATARLITVPDGEDAKSTATVQRVWEQLGAINLTRSDAVVAVGGGATTDLAGFAAASWLRGVRWVPIPTTLLGMVDAAVGGKTGINTEAGKNLVGAFHPPAAVLVDLAFLETLPDDQWVNGMAEVIKAGFIADPHILDLVESDPSAAARSGGPVARELIERSIRVKADVVGRDLREAGPREMLNYGHTLGHAIERHERWQRPHGHAVAIGMVFAAALSRAAGRLDAATETRHRTILGDVGLPCGYGDAGAWPELEVAMAHDKKARGDRLRFVVLDGLARPGILDAPSDEVLGSAWSAVTGSP